MIWGNFIFISGSVRALGMEHGHNEESIGYPKKEDLDDMKEFTRKLLEKMNVTKV